MCLRFFPKLEYSNHRSQSFMLNFQPFWASELLSSSSEHVPKDCGLTED